jgi:(p)ppGpp synthase/HD superfamily hydrolase
MTTFENIQDIITIKEVMDQALSNLYEGKSYNREIDVFGKEVFVYTEGRDFGVEVIITSTQLDFAYVLDNSNSTQSEIIEALIK